MGIFFSTSVQFQPLDSEALPAVDASNSLSDYAAALGLGRMAEFSESSAQAYSSNASDVFGSASGSKGDDTASGDTGAAGEATDDDVEEFRMVLGTSEWDTAINLAKSGEIIKLMDHLEDVMAVMDKENPIKVLAFEVLIEQVCGSVNSAGVSAEELKNADFFNFIKDMDISIETIASDIEQKTGVNPLYRDFQQELDTLRIKNGVQAPNGFSVNDERYEQPANKIAVPALAPSPFGRFG